MGDRRFRRSRGASQLAGAAGASAVALNPFHALFPCSPKKRAPIRPPAASFSIRSTSPPRPFLRRRGLRPSLQPPWSTTQRVAGQTRRFRSLFRTPREKPRSAPAREFRAFLRRNAAICSSISPPFRPRGGIRRRLVPHSRPLSGAGCALSGAIRPRAAEATAVTRIPAIPGRSPTTAMRRKNASDAGMDIGLVGDLAMGVNPDGFDAWAEPDHYARSLRCGAPPDDFQPHGQEWGVLPLNPLLLRQNPAPFCRFCAPICVTPAGFASTTSSACSGNFWCRWAGVLRGLLRPLSIGRSIGVLALESHRNSCLVIGEDLGTVPEGFRERMHEASVFGCAVLYFERASGGAFKRPREYRMKVAVSIATHDLPTLRGYWEGRDCRLRREIGIYSDIEAEKCAR